MEKWAPKVQERLDSVNVNERSAKKGSRYPPENPTPGQESPVKRQVNRPSLFAGCHHYRSAVDELQPIPPSWNWAKIPTYSQIFEVNSFVYLTCIVDVDSGF
jgi:hypothetical protein